MKKFKRTGMSLGPSEERGFGIWIGYDIVGCDHDLSSRGFERADDWSDEKLREHGVTTFVRVERNDVELREKLGLADIHDI